MAERNVARTRHCSHCGQDFNNVTAKGARTHYTGCSRVPPVGPREPNHHPKKSKVTKP